MSDSEDDMPSDIEKVAKEAISNLLLSKSKSKELYEMAYKRCVAWCQLKKVKITSEKAKSQKSSTVWSQYSLLR